MAVFVYMVRTAALLKVNMDITNIFNDLIPHSGGVYG